MDTTPLQGAPRTPRRSRGPVAALALAFLIATPFGIPAVFASTTPRSASATPSGEPVNGSIPTGPVFNDVTLTLGRPNGGFSSVPGMYPPDTSGPSAATIGDISVTGLRTDLGRPNGGFSSVPGMYPPDTSGPSAATIGQAPGVALHGADLASVRAATARFHNIATAEAAGYQLPAAGVPLHECIMSLDGKGGMGFHYINSSLLDAKVQATRPESVIYAPDSHGKLRLVAVEYVVFQSDWVAAHGQTTPKLFGRKFMLVAAPNRYNIPAFFELHAWIWHANPAGMFEDFNPTVSCG
jgi:hypothetical protein